MLDSGFFMEEEPEFDLQSGFNIDLQSDGLLSSNGCQERVELNSVMSTALWELLCVDDEERKERLERDGGHHTEPLKNVEPGDQDERSKEEKMGRALSVCLGPAEGCGHLVRISIEEMETYCKLSRRCSWICGRCRSLFVTVFLTHRKNIITMVFKKSRNTLTSL